MGLGIKVLLSFHFESFEVIEWFPLSVSFLSLDLNKLLIMDYEMTRNPYPIYFSCVSTRCELREK